MTTTIKYASLAALLASAGLAAGCASTTGIGRIDARMVAVAGSHATTDEIELRAGKDGGLAKISVHHADPAGIPDAVRKLADTTWPGSKPVHYESELYADTGMAYEVEVETADGKRCEVSASEAGLLRYTECRLAAAELPPAVAAALAAALPDGVVEEAEVVKGPAVDQFRIEAKSLGRVHYLRIAPDGALQGHTLRIHAEVDVPLP